MAFVYSTIVSEVRFETSPKILETDFLTFIMVFSVQLFLVNGVIDFFLCLGIEKIKFLLNLCKS